MIPSNHNKLFNFLRIFIGHTIFSNAVFLWPSFTFRLPYYFANNDPGKNCQTEKNTFHWLRCSSCGTFLASQGDGPDQYLTIWKWVEEKMVARKSAPAPEHYQLAFAHDQHNKITSCGKSRNFNLDSVWQNFATRFLPTLLNYLTLRWISLFSHTLAKAQISATLSTFYLVDLLLLQNATEAKSSTH